MEGESVGLTPGCRVDYADFLVLMAYDEHWEEGAPGSIASQAWFEKTLDKRMKDLDPAQTIIAIGNYGYDWAPGKPAEDVTYQEAIRSAQESEADIDFDEDAENPHFSYEEEGRKHEVWFLDGVTSFNQIRASDIYKPFGYHTDAQWRHLAETSMRCSPASTGEATPHKVGGIAAPSRCTVTPSAAATDAGNATVTFAQYEALYRALDAQLRAEGPIDLRGLQPAIAVMPLQRWDRLG